MVKKHVMIVRRESRSTGDRRSDETGPPLGWRERRRSVERRMPSVKEDEISPEEWFKHMAFFIAQRSAEKAAMKKAFESLEAEVGSSE
jgi:hypothetical protein